MKSIDKCVSNKISNLNLFLSVFIVALHSSCREQLMSSVENSTLRSYHSIKNR